MKKLMIALAAATTAMFSFGDFTSTGFEDGASSPYKAGELLSTTNDDTGKVDGESGFAKTWVALPADVEEEHTIKAYDAEGAEPTPTKFASEVGSQYLYVETATSNLLERYVQPGGAAASIGDGIYLDTLVKFTPADQPFVESDVADGDKIAISYVGQDPSEVGDGETPISNIVVRAGYVSGSTIVPTNYVMNLPDNADFDVNEWHRLTVRSIANVGSTVAPVGFAIYIDGNKEPLTYASDVAAGDSAYEGALNAAVKTYLYSDTKHALLPSLVDSTYNGYNELTTVGFKGSGCVDNLAFTADPGFIEEGTAVEIAWDEGVATYTVVDSANNTLVDGAATGGTEGSTNLLLEVGITYLTVTATYGTGYEAGKWTVTGDGAAISGGTFTVAEGAKLNINSMTPKFDVGGVHYGTFADALKEAAGVPGSPAVIKMLAPWNKDIAFDAETVNYVVLDLAGQTLTGDSDAAIHTGVANLIITNSTTTIGHVVAPDFDTDKSGTAVICDGAASLTVAAGIFDGGIVPDAEGVTIVVTGGKFYDTAYADDPTGEFYLTSNVDTTKYTISDADEDYYFTVSSSVEPPAPTTFALTTTGGENAEIVTDPADVSALTVATSVKITATATNGFTYATVDLDGTDWSYNSNDDAISMTTNISEDTEIAVPDAVAKTVIGTYEVTVIPTNNTTYAVVGAASNEGDVYTVATGHSITITVTPDSNYEYASAPEGWTLSEGVITKEISAAAMVEIPGPTATGAYPTYIDGIEDAEAKAAYETKYDTWMGTYGADSGSAYATAFLLNIAPSATDQTLEPASITMEGGKVVISANQTLTAVNGKVYVKVATTLAGLASAEWTEATLNEGKVQVTPGSSDTAGFYKIKVDF